MLKQLNIGAKIGFLMLTIAAVVMLVLFILGKVIPDVVVWIFVGGIAVSVVSSLFIKKQE